MSVYSINTVRLAVARALLAPMDLEKAIAHVAETLAIPQETVREVLDSAMTKEPA